MRKYLFGTLLLLAMPAWAVEPYAATPAEAAMCQARVYSRLGPRNENTMHMHHYCDGLRFLNRAYSAMGDKQDMKYYLDVSINNFNYVLGHTRPDYVMRGEVHVGKARALKLMGKKAEAIAEFNQALRYDIDSPDAYQALADFYQETGDKSKALEMVTKGLRHSPDSKGLKRRYTELGGQLPYPEPIQPVPVVNAQPVEPEVTLPTEPAVAAEPPKIGSPDNPYCRFCPD